MIDDDEDGLITFREFAQGLGIICKGELQDRMQFMYRMHVPPALCDEAAEELSDEESLDSCMELTENGGIEVSASQARGQGQSRDQCGSGRGEIAVCISPGTNGEAKRTDDEDNVKRVRASDIPPMSQVKVFSEFILPLNH